MDQIDTKKETSVLHEIKKDHHIRFWVSFTWYFILYVVLLPITVGYLFSKVLLRFLRYMHFLIAGGKHSLRFIIVCNAFLSLLSIAMAAGLFAFTVWSVEQHASWDIPLWNYGGDNSLLISLSNFVDILIDYLIYGSIFGASLTFFAKLLLLISCDSYIRAVKIKDQIQVAKLKETGVTFIPSHRFMRIIEKWIDYAYGEKLLHHYEVIASREKKNAILSVTAGQIISRENKIIFYKEYWRNHVIFCGGSKAGITNNVITYVAHVASQKSPVIYVDSEFDPQTRSNLVYIAEKERAELTMVNFVNKNMQYNIFKDKSVDQITKLFMYCFDEEINDKVTSYKLTYLILTLIVANPEVPMSLKAIIRHLDAKYLTRTYDKASNFELFNLLTSKNIPQLISQMKAIFTKFNKTYGSYFSSDSTAISASDIFRSKNDILYVNIPSHHTNSDKQKIYRLIFKDVVLMSSFGSKERNELKRTAVFYTPLLRDLFLTQADITSSLATLTNNNVGLALEVKDGVITPETLPTMRELFVLCKSYIIHKTQNETLLEAIKFGMDATNTRGIKAHNFDEDSDIKYHDLRDKTKYKEFSDNIKNDVITSIKELPSWKIYFKTLHFSSTTHSTSFDSVIYSEFFSPIQFSQTAKVNEKK